MPGHHGGKYSHKDYGLSYMGAPQGYRDDGGKPMGKYGHPRNGYIDQGGMPNGGGMKKAMDYLASLYGGGGGMSSSTNAGTAPSVSSMDSTYKAGPAQTPIQMGGNKYA